MRVRLGVASFAVWAICFTCAGCGGGGDAAENQADSGPGDAGRPESCNIEAPSACPSPAPTYANVAPIFESRCASCHGATPGGPWSLRDYEHVVDWADSIRGELVACAMPPPDARVPITKEERLTLLNWIRCDTPR